MPLQPLARASNAEASMSNFPPDAMLTRDKSAEALSKLGYPVTKATLATLASRGGGPLYHRFGKRVRQYLRKIAYVDAFATREEK